MGISKKIRFQVLTRDDSRCQYCGRGIAEVPLEVDHRVPRSAGGTDAIDNLVTACRDCNRGKYTERITREWVYWGHPDMAAPLAGESVRRVEQYPVTWVFRGPKSGEFLLVEDELVAHRWEAWPFEKRLRHGPPCFRDSDGGKASSAWHGFHEAHKEYPELLGLYVPLEVQPSPDGRMGLQFYTCADCLQFLAIALPPDAEDGE